MTVLPLLFQSELSKGFAQRRIVKQRVVTEAARSVRRSQKPACGFSPEYGLVLAITIQGNHADILTQMLSLRQALQRGNERSVVLFVVRVCVTVPRVDHRRVTRGINSRRAVKVIHGEARVLGQHQGARRPKTVILGLDAGVGFERLAVFYRSREVLQAGKKIERQAQT